MKLALYVSGHGFGHATREAALLEALDPGGADRILLRTVAPLGMFGDAGKACEPLCDPFDVGMTQASALSVDAPATLSAHREHLADFDAVVARERARLTAFAPDAVVSDCGPAPIEAAAALGVPAFVLGNFTWDWILDEYARTDPRWRPIVDRYARAYARADAYWRLPFHGDETGSFRKIVDFPHLVRRRSLSREETLRSLGLEPGESRPLVLVSFGGFAADEFTGADPDGLSEFIFVGFTDPPPGLRATWIRLPTLSPVSTVDLVAAAGAVIGKLGYGTAAECLVYGTRMLFVPRTRFREIGVIERAVAEAGGFRALSRGDFLSGRWRAPLRRLLQTPPPRSQPGDGAERIAAALAESAIPGKSA